MRAILKTENKKKSKEKNRKKGLPDTNPEMQTAVPTDRFVSNIPSNYDCPSQRPYPALPPPKTATQSIIIKNAHFSQLHPINNTNRSSHIKNLQINNTTTREKKNTPRHTCTRQTSRNTPIGWPSLFTNILILQEKKKKKKKNKKKNKKKKNKKTPLRHAPPPPRARTSSARRSCRPPARKTCTAPPKTAASPASPASPGRRHRR
jgi:hypothetical protein